MANEKTEEATPKRREEEREKGNIAKSHDFQAAVLLTLAFLLLFALAKFFLHDIQNMMYWAFTNLQPDKINPDNIIGFLAPFGIYTAKITVPFLAVYCFLVLVVIRMLIGHLFAPSRIKPNFEKFAGDKLWNNLKSKLNIFSLKNIVELVKSFVKLLIVGGCGYWVLHARKDELAALLGADVSTFFMVLGKVIFQILCATLGSMLILGFLDKKYQTYEYEKSIKMTKQEVKDEYKNTEGDPQIKGQQRRRMMQASQRRMMQELPNADVVITNPTHYAVAISYDAEKYDAPRVIAKGEDYLAQKIKEIAKENDIEIVENKPLARMLYANVDVGEFVPPELYQAVAEVLAFVYHLKGKV